MSEPMTETMDSKGMKVDISHYDSTAELMRFVVIGPCTSIDHYQRVQEALRQCVNEINQHG